MVFKTVFFVSRGHFWRNDFLFHKTFKFFSCFQTLRKTFRIFRENNLVGLSKLFSSVQGIFLEEFNFENIFVELFLRFFSSVTNFSTFGEIFAIGLSKLHSLCPVEIFDWTFFLQKLMSFFTVFGLWGKYSGTLAQRFQKKCQNAIHVDKKNFVEILIFEEKAFAIFSSTD